MEAIERDFGSFDIFRAEMTAKTVGVEGSGWGWLVSQHTHTHTHTHTHFHPNPNPNLSSGNIYHAAKCESIPS